MALTNYTELKASIGSWLADSTLTSVIPDFIKLCESKINSILRTRWQETTATLATDIEGVASLPDDFEAVKAVIAAGVTRTSLNYITQDAAEEKYSTRYSGTPTDYTIIGDNIYVFPAYEGDIDLIYYASVPSLSDTTTTNWVLDKFAGVYLYGSLWEAAKYRRNSDLIAYAENQFNNELALLQKSSRTSKWEVAQAKVSKNLP